MATTGTTFVTTVLICTTMLLLLPVVFSTRAENYGVPRLSSPTLEPDFSFLKEFTSGRSIMISAWPDLQEGIWNLGSLLISVGCGYFCLRWIRNYLDQSGHFASNFH